MSMSRKRRQAVYDAVHRPLMDLRIEVARLTNGTELGRKLDDMLYRTQMAAASGAVDAADPPRPSPHTGEATE